MLLLGAAPVVLVALLEGAVALWSGVVALVLPAALALLEGVVADWSGVVLLAGGLAAEVSGVVALLVVPEVLALLEGVAAADWSGVVPAALLADGLAEASGAAVLALDEVEGVVVVVVVVVELDCVLAAGCPAEAAADGVGSVLAAPGFEAVLDALGVVLAAPAAAAEGWLLADWDDCVLALLVWSGAAPVAGAAAPVAGAAEAAAAFDPADDWSALELVLGQLAAIIFTLSTLYEVPFASAAPVMATRCPTWEPKSWVLPESFQDLPDWSEML
jgi:hypothetical protein